METTTSANPSRVRRTITTLTPNLAYADWLCAAASALLLALCFPPFDQAYFIFIALIPVLTRAQAKNTKHNLYLGLATGFLYNLVLLHWLVYVTGPGMVLLALVVGAPLMFPFWVWGALMGCWYRVPAFALSWCLVEYLRSIGPFSFSWGFLGHATFTTFYTLTLMQAVEWFGIIGISFLLAGFNASFALVLHRLWFWAREWTPPQDVFRSLKFDIIVMEEYQGFYLAPQDVFRSLKFDVAFFVLFVLLLIGNLYLGSIAGLNHSKFIYEHPVNLRVALIQGSYQQDAKESASVDTMLSGYLELSRKAMADKPDMIVWPESTVPYPLNLWEVGLHQITSFVKENDVELLLGSVHAEITSDEKVLYYNRALHFSPDLILNADDPAEMILRNVDHYDKMHLVPYGEWIPGGQYWPFYYIETFIEEAGAGIFQPGRKQTIFETRSGLKFAVMICFESTLSWEARLAKQNGADFLVNLTNDAWFKRSAGLKQHFIQCQFRAVETRLPVLRAANTGITGFISPVGSCQSIPDNEPGYYLAELRIPVSN